MSASVLAAQEPGPAAAGECAQGRISQVFIDNHSVFDLSDPELSPRFGWAYRLANRLHPATDEQLIRRELLFGEGDCYDVERLRDSERLLRSLNILSSVDIFGVRQADGTIHVIVDTEDEWSLRVDARWGDGDRNGLTGLRLREDNVLGTGQHVSAFYRESQAERVFGATYYSPQLFGTRWDGLLEGGRTQVGFLATQSVAYPFVGEVGRWAFRQAIQHRDSYFEYLVPREGELLRVWFPQRRVFFDLGAAHRWGREGGSRTFLGGALTGEWVSYPEGVRYADDRLHATGSPPPEPPFALDSIASVRATVLLGQRNVYFVRRRGLDTVNGTEDVRLGVEAELALGPSLGTLSTGRDLAMSFGLFVGSELTGLGLAGTNLAVEARRTYQGAPDRSEWSDVFGEVDVWTYLRRHPESRSVLVAALSAVGGWNDAVPFQLSLGGNSGLRGYPDHVEPGGRRLVATVEHRRYLGWPYPDLFDLGTVLFADVGKIWAGESAFGVSSPVLADVGFGLRAGFPPGSRQTFRLDVGFPLGSGFRARDVVFTLGVGQTIGLRSQDHDPQLQRSLRRGISASGFTVPR